PMLTLAGEAGVDRTRVAIITTHWGLYTAHAKLALGHRARIVGRAEAVVGRVDAPNGVVAGVERAINVVVAIDRVAGEYGGGRRRGGRCARRGRGGRHRGGRRARGRGGRRHDDGDEIADTVLDQRLHGGRVRRALAVARGLRLELREAALGGV